LFDDIVVYFTELFVFSQLAGNELGLDILAHG
jgi:hypothetical protein